MHVGLADFAGLGIALPRRVGCTADVQQVSRLAREAPRLCQV